MTPLHAALKYAEAGWPVLPLHTPNGKACDCAKGEECASPGKHPRTMNGLSSASTERAVVEGWFGKRWNHANVGIVVPGGYVVLDIDGDEGIAALKDAGLPMPPTAIARTGRPNGWHYVYKTTTPIRPKVGILPHVDVRGPGSYIVAAPSRHISGVEYRWKVGLEHAVEAPAWIAEKSSSLSPRELRADDPAEPISEGGQERAPGVDGRLDAPPRLPGGRH